MLPPDPFFHGEIAFWKKCGHMALCPPLIHLFMCRCCVIAKKVLNILGLINTTDSYVCFDKVGLSVKMILGWWLSFAFNYFLIALKGNLLLSLKMYKFWIRFSKICLWDAFNHLLQMPTFKIHQIWVALIILSKYSMDGCKCEHPASY